MEENHLYVGYAREKITPPIGMNIPGHGFVPRLSEGVLDDVYAYAVAFSDGQNRSILFNCDALGVLTAGGNRIRQKVAQICGIPVEAVYLACTHCHTAMWIGGSVTEDEPDCAYYIKQEDILCDLAQLALKDMKPATMRIARGHVDDVGFIRRYKMKDGTLATNPSYMNPNILDYDGKQDTSLQLVRFLREGGKELVLVNFGTHPDVVNGRNYSPDWPGYTVEVVKAGLGGEAEVVMLNGFGGDSNHCYRFAPKPAIKGREFAKRMARKVGGEALKIYDDAQEIPVGKVSGFSQIATFGINPHEKWEEPIAKQIVDTGALQDKDLPEELRKYGISIKKALRILSNMKRTEDFHIPIYGLQVGNLCFIGVPGEPFSETGINIKNASKMDMTICTCRTNGSNGYFPTPRAYAGSGYERDYTAFGPDCTQSIEAAAQGIISKMEKA